MTSEQPPEYQKYLPGGDKHEQFMLSVQGIYSESLPTNLHLTRDQDSEALRIAIRKAWTERESSDPITKVHFHFVNIIEATFRRRFSAFLGTSREPQRSKEWKTLNDTEKLRFLAEWFDVKDQERAAIEGRGLEPGENEIQFDLRRIADRVERLDGAAD